MFRQVLLPNSNCTLSSGSLSYRSYFDSLSSTKFNSQTLNYVPVAVGMSSPVRVLRYKLPQVVQILKSDPRTDESERCVHPTCEGALSRENPNDSDRSGVCPLGLSDAVTPARWHHRLG